MKRHFMFVLALFISLFSFSTFAATNLFAPKPVFAEACVVKMPVSDETKPSFCTDFKGVIKCQCDQQLSGSALCNDPQQLYLHVIKPMFGSIKIMCHTEWLQHGTAWMDSEQACDDQWQCYLNGKQKAGDPECSGTGSACVA